MRKKTKHANQDVDNIAKDPNIIQNNTEKPTIVVPWSDAVMEKVNNSKGDALRSNLIDVQEKVLWHGTKSLSKCKKLKGKRAFFKTPIYSVHLSGNGILIFTWNKETYTGAQTSQVIHFRGLVFLAVVADDNQRTTRHVAQSFKESKVQPFYLSS